MRAGDLRVPGRRQWLWVIVAGLVWTGVMGTAAALLVGSQAGAREAVLQRLQARVASGAEFAALDVEDIFHRELIQARFWLHGAASYGRLSAATHALDSPAAVLLDRQGRLLAVLPDKRALLGKNITGRYAHLRSAIGGRRAVSDVVRSEVQQVPVVAFAVPFSTQAGRRVFGVAFEVAHTPLGSYMSHILVIPGRRVYLIDGRGWLIAASGAASTGRLAQRAPALARALGHGAEGTLQSALGSTVFVSEPVYGTPWRIVATVPSDQLYNSVDGASRTLSWLVWAALALAGFIIIAIGTRLARSRARLAELAHQLDRLARIDRLTGISNRRDLEERLAAAGSSARRSGEPLSVLLIDVDHFKTINDEFGHETGDWVLLRVANALRGALRAEDAVGRWGGEEFLAILPHTDAAAAMQIAERLRRTVAQSTPTHPVTATVGAATLEEEEEVSQLVARADRALYEGKAAGRDRVHAALGARPDPAVPA